MTDSSTKTQTLTFHISGLKCQNCVKSSRQALEALDGVSDIRIDLETSESSVEFDPTQVNGQQINEAIEGAGFTTDLQSDAANEPEKEEAAQEAPDASAPHEVQLRVNGMHCASCESSVKRSLEKIEGVDSASASFASGRANAKVSAEVQVEQLVEAIRKAGYESSVIESDEDDPAAELAREREQAEADANGWKWRFIGATAGSLAITAIMFSSSNMALTWLSALIGTGVQVVAGGRFYGGAWRGLKARSANMDTLIALSTTVAWGFGIWQWIAGAHAAHEFMTATMILAFISLGKWLETRGRIKATDALRSLLELGPSIAHLVSESGEVEDVPAKELAVGDRVRVLTGDRVPADGVLETDRAELDEAMLTGEPLPATREKGEMITGGTVNAGAPFTMRIERVGSATSLRQIAARVSEAQNSRPKMQALADKTAAIFVPAVMGIALLTGAICLAVGLEPAVALYRVIAVLIVACPCALGLATPLAVMAGVGVASRQGIIVRSAVSLEASAKLDTIVFDKTGTLTRGEPAVTHVVALGEKSENDLLEIAAQLESESTHPIARAITDEAESRGLDTTAVGDLETITGRGVRSAQMEIVIGSELLLRDESVKFEAMPPVLAEAESRGETVILIGRPGGELLGGIALADQIKEGTREAIAELQEFGLKTVVISGDSEEAVRATAAQLGIDDFHARVSPEEKADKIRAMQSDGRSVAMVGDGINDAPALAQANLGIAMAQGSDIARQASDITLLSDSPAQVATALRLARKVRRKMIQNLAWAFVYNLALIPLAAFGIMQPIYAAAAMAASSVSVVFNALLLYRAGPS